MSLSASYEVEESLLVPKIEVGCKNFRDKSWDRNSVKSFGDIYCYDYGAFGWFVVVEAFKNFLREIRGEKSSRMLWS